jgi:hypothetical protein
MSQAESYLHFLVEQDKKKGKTVNAPSMPSRLSTLKPLKKKEGGRGAYEQIKKLVSAADPNEEVEYTEDGLVKVNYGQLYRALNTLDNLPTKRGMGFSSIIYGEAGIGKSSIVEQRGVAAAAALGRTFIRLDEYVAKFDTIEEFKKNLKNYYVFIDERASGFDPSMVAGIPDPTSPEKKGFLTELPVPWVSIMTMSDEAAGMLFLDEINQADANVQNNLFSLTNFEERRIVGKYKIRGDWRIHCAGNWGEGYSIVPLVPALKERLAPYYLILDFKGWQDWAANSKNANGDSLIHPLLMDFIEDDPDKNFYARPTDETDPTKRPNPRNLVALSSAIYTQVGTEASAESVSGDQWREIIASAGALCGKEFGNDFKQFLVSNAVVDVNELLEDPSKLINVKGGRAAEGIVTQNISVFKRNLKQHVVTFDNKFNAAKTDEEKDEMINLGLYYMDVINSVFRVEPSTASNIFTVITNRNTLPDLKIYRNILISALKGKGDNESATFVMDLINDIVSEVTGNVKAFTTEEGEEGEATQATNSQAVNKIDQILRKFNQDIASGNIPEYV